MTIEIKNRFTGEIIFSHNQENNTIKNTVEYAAIKGASLREANLRGASLWEADLRGASLREADLWGVDLRGASLRGADLRGASLYGASLYGASLREANLWGANLRGADLREADLWGVDLRGAKNVPFIPLACPSDGGFIGWKKVENYLIKLRIHEDAKRSSATTNKCRCDKAFVEGIYNLDGTIADRTSVTNTNHVETVYEAGKLVYPDSFDEDRWNECSHGIHFFINKQEAINY